MALLPVDKMDCLPLQSFAFTYFICGKDQLVFRVQSNLVKWTKSQQPVFSCPRCGLKLWEAGTYAMTLYGDAYVQSLNEKIRRLEERVARMDELERRVAAIEYAPTGGPEFLKLVEEAKAAGDFQP